MNPRPVEDILADMNPIRSKSEYEKSWREFLAFCMKDRPEEEDYLQYFDYLKREKGFAPSTLWKIYSMLSHNHQLFIGGKLQQYPRVTLLLKGYAVGHERKKASSFRDVEINSFLRMPLLGSYWQVRKAAVSIAYCGGIRGIELRGLQMKDFEFNTSDGYYVDYSRGKAKGEREYGRFLVPFNQDKTICMATILRTYLCQLEDNGITTQGENPVFYTGKKDSVTYAKSPIGKNMLAVIGKEVAEVLGLENPKTYTGHTFRRTAARQAADNGATTSDLKRHFGWKSVNTADKYIDESSHRVKKMAQIMMGNPQNLEGQHIGNPLQNGQNRSNNQAQRGEEAPRIVATYDNPIVQGANVIKFTKNSVQNVQNQATSSTGSKVIHINMAPNSSLNIF